MFNPFIDSTDRTITVSLDEDNRYVIHIRCAEINMSLPVGTPRAAVLVLKENKVRHFDYGANLVSNETQFKHFVSWCAHENFEI